MPDPEDDTPGPGNYNEGVKVPRPVENFSSSFVSGRGPQDYFAGNENPGPSVYQDFKSVNLTTLSKAAAIHQAKAQRHMCVVHARAALYGARRGGPRAGAVLLRSTGG